MNSNSRQQAAEVSTDYLSLLHSLPHGFALHEIIFNEDNQPYDYRFVMVNSAFEKITELCADEVIGRTVRELLPTIEQKWKDFYGHVVISGCAFEFDEFNKDLSKHFRVYVYCPQPGHFAVIFYDISREVEEETSQAHARRWFQQLFDAVPVMMLSVDERGKIQNVNQSFLEKTLWLRSQLVGRPISDLIHFNGEQAGEKNNIEFWVQPETLHLPCRLEYNDHRTESFLVDCRRLRDPLGETLSICVFKELDAIGDLSGILQESDERFRGAFEHSGIGMALVSREGYFLQVNPALCRIVGYTVDEMLAVKFQQITFPEDTPYDLANLERLLRGESESYSMEKRYIHKEGHLVWVNLTVTAVHHEGGKVKHFVAQVQEITDRKKFELELLRAKDAAEAGSRAKSAFLAQMSHEIRTPMNSIIAPANMLLEVPLEEDVRELIEMIQKSAEHLMNVINDILDYSKIEANKMELEIVPFHLLELAQDVLAQGKMAAQDKGLSLDIHLEDDTPIVWNGDPSRIRQILFNLVNNAIKFTREGGVRIHAGKRTNPENRNKYYLYLSVEDTGIGISADQQKHLFEAFQQADPSIHRKYGGSGLGLVICQKLVELMDGFIELKSEVGKGTRLNILLPCTIAEGEDIPTRRRPPVPLNIPQLTNRKVLVVDDNIPNQKVAVQMLLHLGCIPSVAGNGQEAVEMNNRFDFDLILMDCEMPVMDGFEATRKIRALEKTNSLHIPIVALTAHASRATNQECFSSGMDDYVSKPADLSHLAETLQKWLKTSPTSPR
ncbi:MAG: PAS domain S-box protein [Chthoniobacterales bacterium]